MTIAEATIHDSLEYAKQNGFLPSDNIKQAEDALHWWTVDKSEHDAMMRRYNAQVETIRQIIDERGLTSDEKELLDKLILPREFDRRTAK